MGSSASSSASVWLLMLIAVVAANLPFINERLFIVGPQRPNKSLGWRLIELLLLWVVVLGIGFALEAYAGQTQPQGWEFFAAIGFLFLTLAFPGFVWRYLRRRS